MYCLDTNIIIDIFHGDTDLKLHLDKIISSGATIFITPITLCELYKGAYTIFNSEKEVKEIDNFVSSLELLDFDQTSCKFFGEIYAKLKKIGKMSGQADLMIASIVKANNLIFITRNKKHFEHTGIKVEEW